MIFYELDIESLRKCENPVTLKDFTLAKSIRLDKSYNTLEVKLQEETIPEAEFKLAALLKKIRKTSFCYENIHGATMEAVFNAHVHGNKRSTIKHTRVHYQISPELCNIFVEDEGEIIDPRLFQFIDIAKNPACSSPDYYQFINASKPTDRGGTGIHTIFYWSDQVNFYSNIAGGLVINMEFCRN
jgi:anti-sigma regulatory factor (Ser/Thr protein kinase)